MPQSKRRPKPLALGLRPPRSHGGARSGAGRPKTSKQVPHTPRPKFSERSPLHITLKLAPRRPSLRRKDILKALRQAVLRGRKSGLAIIHFALLSNHLHMIVESSGKEALSRQMQSVGIALGKRIARITAQPGPVLYGRYHSRALRTPTEVKNALRYVLTNELKHEGFKGCLKLDAFSSALDVLDETWRELLGARWARIVGFPPWLGSDEEEVMLALSPFRGLLCAPRSWLLRVGWLRAI